MKKPILLLSAVAALTCAASCKQHVEGGDDVGAGTHNSENYQNEQGKSDVTETGQHIGSDQDSTSMRGEPGKVSNY